MDTTQARILLAEDDQALAAAIMQTLQTSGFVCESACTGTDALRKLAAGKPDLVLLDYHLPDMRAEEFLEHLDVKNGVVPFIVMSGHGNERIAVEMMKAGASDYLGKDSNLLSNLPGIIHRTLGEIQKRRRYEAVETALTESERRLSDIIEFLPDAIMVVDEKGSVIAWNHAMEALTGVMAADMLGKDNYAHALPFHGMRRPQLVDFVMDKSLDLASYYPEAHWVGDTLVHDGFSIMLRGRRVNLWAMAKALLDSNGRVTGAISSIRDITARKEAEEEKRSLQDQLLQAQKMESIGRLAGGIAHDFNNLLSPIIGYCDMILGEISTEHEFYKRIVTVNEAAMHAKNLTWQLLAFSRRQFLETKVVDLNKIITDVLSILRRTLRENVEIRTNLSPRLARIKADASQIEYIILNLALNAQDSMTGIGEICITTSNITIGDAHAQLKPGAYTLLCMSDTGQGMDGETLAHVFEPFYATSESGRDTGLGLSSVYGIVNQHGGTILAQSAPGMGTTFQIYLPQYESGDHASLEPPFEAVQTGSETILVVEDEDVVRELIYLMLDRKGYKVLRAANAEQAIQISAKTEGAIDLLITDIVMPKMSGHELYNVLIQTRPGLKVVYISGYTEEIIRSLGISSEKVRLLHKPFTVQSLTGIIRTVLDE